MQFLYIALGSLAEVETQLIIAEKVGYLNESGKLFEKLVLNKRMLLGLIKYLKKKNVRGES